MDQNNFEISNIINNAKQNFTLDMLKTLYNNGILIEKNNTLYTKFPVDFIKENIFKDFLSWIHDQK